MMDSGAPPQRALCFLSTLLSQKVPEKSDTVLRCMISGHPKPEVTWYKNGQTIEECGIISSYEFFQHQYIHMLHLYCCTQADAAVYQVSAKNGQGMICCSASIEVECGPSTSGPGTPEPKKLESSEPQGSKKAPPDPAEAMTSWATPVSADVPSSQSHDLALSQPLANGDLSASSTDHPQDVEATKQTEVATYGQLQPESSLVLRAQVDHLPPASAPCPIFSVQKDTLNHEDPNDAALNSAPPTPGADKYISFSLPLPSTLQTTSEGSPSQHPSPQPCSEDSDSDYELCPEITFTYTEEFSDDDLEYLECSDVMTDYSNAIWQRRLQGAERVFLLESDDEEPELGERGLGGCEPLGSEAGVRQGVSQGVSGNAEPMDTTADVCAHHSRPPEVGGRRHRQASPHRPSSPMILSWGPHQVGMSPVAGQQDYKRPEAPQAVGNEYPGIPGETRSGHHAREEFGSDNLLNMEEEAGTQSELRCSPGELETPGRDQNVEPTATEARTREKDSLGLRVSEKPTRGKRPGMKGKAKKLKGSAPGGPATQRPGPTEPALHPLGRSNNTRSPCDQAKATTQDTEVCTAAGEGAFPTPMQPETPPLQTGEFLSREGVSSEEEKGQVGFENLPEISHTPEGKDRAQAEEAPLGGSGLLSPALTSPESVGEPAEPTEASTGAVSHRGRTSDDHVPGTLHPQGWGCAGSTKPPKGSNRAHRRPTMSRGALGHTLSVPEANAVPTSCCVFTATCVHPESHVNPCEPKALSGALPGPPGSPEPVSSLDTAHPGPEGKETEGSGEPFGTDDVGTGESPDSPSGCLVDGHLLLDGPPLGLEMDQGQGQVPKVGEHDEELGLLLQTMAARPPQTPRQSSQEATEGGCSPSPCPAAWGLDSLEAKDDSPGETGLQGLNLSSLTEQGESCPPVPRNRSARDLPEAEAEDVCDETFPTTDPLDSHSRDPHNTDTLDTDCRDLHTTDPLDTDSWDPHTSDPLDTDSRDLHITDTLDSHYKDPYTMNSSASKSTEGTHPLEMLVPSRVFLDDPQMAVDRLATAAPVHPSQLLPVSVACCSLEDSLEEPSSLTSSAKSPQLPPSPSSPLTPTEAPEEGFSLVPLGPDIPKLVPDVPEGEGSENEPPLETGGEHQAVVGVDGRLVPGGLPEFEGALSLSVPNESPPGSGCAPGDELHFTVAQDESWMPAEATGALLPLGPLSQTLQGAWEGGSVGCASRKLRIITLEASLPQGWIPGLPEEGPMLPAGTDSPRNTKALNTLSPWSWGPSVLTEPRDTPVSLEPTRDVHRAQLPPQPLNCVGLLESSVDPMDESEPCSSGEHHEAPRSREKEDLGPRSSEPDMRPAPADSPSFLQQLLTCARLLVSSVDPKHQEARGPARPSAVFTVGMHRVADPSQPISLLTADSTPGGEVILGVPDVIQGSEGSENRAQVPHGQTPVLQALGPHGGEETISQGNHRPESSRRSFEAEGPCTQDPADTVLSELPCPHELATGTGTDKHHAPDRAHDVPKSNLDQAKIHQPMMSSGLAESGALGDELRDTGSVSSGLAMSPPVPDISTIPQPGDPNSEGSQITDSPAAIASLMLPGPKETQSDPGRTRTRAGMEVNPSSKRPGTPVSETVRKKKPEPSGNGHLADGMKKKILSRVAALRQRLEKENCSRKSMALPRKDPELGGEEKKDPKKLACRKGGKAPVLLKRIQAELLPDHPGNLRLSCQFSEIHEDSIIRWTKDSETIAQEQRSAGDNSTVSLAIVQASQKDQGLYYCSLHNSFGKVTAEFNLTAQVLQQLSSCPDVKACEEIEFSQLIFREDFLKDSYFGDRLRGQIATEALHFGEGVHRKAFRSRVMRGLLPVFQPGHACVLKVHNAVAYGTRSNAELVQRNYKLAAQECYVQNTARHYAKIYAAEAQPLEGFGEVPEIIPIFLIHRPENNIPYATVEEELIGEFVKYSMRDGKEINFLRRDSEAGQKCCTFQHWVYQKTGGCMLVTDMQGVGMKLTDVGIATLAKGYKGFKGNCSISFIDQFKALHQCNKYCEMLGLKSLQSQSQKPKKSSCVVGKSKAEPPSRKASGSPTEKKF